MEAGTLAVARPGRTLLATVSFVLVGLVYLVVANSLSAEQAFWSPDAGPRFAMITNWARYGDIVTLRTGFEADDPMGRVHGLSGYLAHLPGRTCTLYPPLAPLLSAPFYRWLGFSGLAVVPALCGLGTILFTWAAARRLSLAWLPGIPLVLGLATPLLVYSTVYWDHSVQMCISAAAFWAVLRGIQQGARRWVAAGGFLLGSGLLVHEVFLVLMAASVLAGLAVAEFRRRHLLPLLVGLVAAVAVWMGLNASLYGVLLGPHLRGPNNLVDPYFVQKLFDPRDLLARSFGQLFGAPEELVPALWLSLIVLGYWLCTAFSAEAIYPRLLCIGLAAACAALLISRGRWAQGLFEATPLLVLAVAALPRPSDAASDPEAAEPVCWVWLRRTTLVFLVGVVVSPKIPGMDWGSRFLLAALPPLFLLTWKAARQELESMPRAWRPVGALVLAGLVAVSLVSQARGVAAVRTDLRDSRRWAGLAQAAHAPVVLTDMFWLAAEMAARPEAPTVFRYDGQVENGPILVEVLRRDGSRRLGFFGTPEGLSRVRAVLEQHGAQIQAQTYYSDPVITGERWEVEWPVSLAGRIGTSPR